MNKNRTASVVGVGLTAYGLHPGATSLDLQASAALAAVRDAGAVLSEIDGLITGYSTTWPNVMPANVLADELGLKPTVSQTLSVGGSTGLAMVDEAVSLVRQGRCKTVLVVAGENRKSGQTRETSTETLAQVGNSRHEVPLGLSVPGYYALLASEYVGFYGFDFQELAALPVLMRENAGRHKGAQYRQPISADDVMSSKTISSPLRLLDCCPVSDGGAAVVVSSNNGARDIKVSGFGRCNKNQYVSNIDVSSTGAAESAAAALEMAAVPLSAVEAVGIYDSFSITLAVLLEEIGLAPRGGTAELARTGHFSVDGAMPLNTHGGLLSYGHSGVAGGLAHLVELVVQMRGEAGTRQISGADGTPRAPRVGFVHADGGVLSAHVSMVLEGAGKIAADREPFSLAGIDLMSSLAVEDSALHCQVCRACGYRRVLRTRVCPHCGSPDLSVAESSSSGRVVAVTRTPEPTSGEEIVVVELEDLFRTPGLVRGGAAYGDSVSFVGFEEREQRRIPIFVARK